MHIIRLTQNNISIGSFWGDFILTNRNSPKTITNLYPNYTHMHNSNTGFQEQCTLAVYVEYNYKDDVDSIVSNSYKYKNSFLSTLLVIRIEGCFVPYYHQRRHMYSNKILFYFRNCQHLNPDLLRMHF